MDTDKVDEVALPFDPRKQDATLGHLLLNEKFLSQCYSRIQPDWFDDVRNQTIYRILVEYRAKKGRSPLSLDEFKGLPQFQAMDQAERNALHGAVERCRQAAPLFHIDGIRDELTIWLKCRVFKDSIVKATKIYNQKRYDELAAIASQMSRDLASVKFHEDEVMSFSDPGVYLKAAAEQKANCLTTGLPIFDERLGGGLFRGDVTVLLAPSNSGKTTTMITVARHNIEAGKNVLLLTHEGRPDDIRTKMLMSMLGVSQGQLMSLYDKPGGPEKVGEIVDKLEKRFRYLPYNKAGMTVEDVMGAIRRQQELFQSQSPDGKGFDLIVDDYPAKLTTVQAKTGNMAKRNIDDIVYDQFVQLALELNVHCLCAIQTNRQGSRVNQQEDRLLTMEDVSESWGVMTSATNVITIRRNGEDAKKDRIYYHVAKTRSAPTGSVIVCRSNFDKCISHSKNMGCAWYVGSDTVDDVVDNMLANHRNSCVTDEIQRARNKNSGDT